MAGRMGMQPPNGRGGMQAPPGFAQPRGPVPTGLQPNQGPSQQQ
jgi:hypothetical protein